MTPQYLRLGATLYVPATRPDVAAVANGERLPNVRSVIVCTEDSVHPAQVQAALESLSDSLPRLRDDGPRVFVRPRSPEVLDRILAMPGIERVAGFVLPKSTVDSLTAYAAQVPDGFTLMPTLETPDVFDPGAMVALRAWLQASELRPRILAIRVGGNDILNLLGIRRRPGRTIYDTAAGPVVAGLVAAFQPFGFAVTAPVFDDFGDLDTLRAEVSRDLDHGLMSKSAIHPAQIEPIEKGYRVPRGDVEAARRILDPHAKAVFQVDRVMCEPATHTRWARMIVERAEAFGIEPAGAEPAATRDATLGRRLALP